MEREERKKGDREERHCLPLFSGLAPRDGNEKGWRDPFCPRPLFSKGANWLAGPGKRQTQS